MLKNFIFSIFLQLAITMAVIWGIVYFAVGKGPLSFADVKKRFSGLREISTQGFDALHHQHDMGLKHLQAAAEAAGDPSLVSFGPPSGNANAAMASETPGATCSCPQYDQMRGELEALTRRLNRLEAEHALPGAQMDRASLQDPNRGKIRIIR